MKIRLIDDWRRAGRMLSVQLAALLGLVSTAYDYLPAIQQYLPEGWVRWMALAIIAARLLHQQSLHKGADDAQRS